MSFSGLFVLIHLINFKYQNSVPKCQQKSCRKEMYLCKSLILLHSGVEVFMCLGQSSSSSSLCRRLLDFPFCVLFFLNEVGPPSSPREVIMRSLNFGFGSGGRSAGALAVLPSTWGNCKSTPALERKEKGNC